MRLPKLIPIGKFLVTVPVFDTKVVSRHIRQANYWNGF